MQWYLYDGLGSVTASGDAAGNIIQTLEYDVWGAQRAGQGTSSNALKYVGSLGHPTDDDTGLIYMRARYYDPGVGRFVSEDPAGDGDNWYAYANSDPVDSFDPDGLYTPSDVQKILYIAVLTIRAWFGNADTRPGVFPQMPQKPPWTWSFHLELKAIKKSMRRFKGPEGKLLAGAIGFSSLDTYLQRDPLGFAAIMADLSGEHGLAAQLDALNSGG